MSSQQIKPFFNEKIDYLKMYHLAVTRLKLLAYKALYDINKCILIIFREEVTSNYTKNISNFIRFLSFYGSFIKYSTTTNQWSKNSQDFLDIIIYTDRYYRGLCFTKIAGFPPRLLTRCLKFE